MKKLLTLSILSMAVTACTDSAYSASSAQINAERNAEQSIITTAALEQHRMQRQNQLEEAILARQRGAMKNEDQRDQASTVNSWYKATLGQIIK